MRLEALRRIRENIDASLDELAAHLDATGAQALAEDDPEALGSLFELMDAIKATLKDGRKGVNKACDAVASHFSEILMHAELVPYRHEIATFSPSARIFPAIKDARKFIAWLEARGTEDPLQAFADAAQKDGTLRALCEAQLEQGLHLPDGVGGFVQRRVSIRRKRKGRTSNGQEEQDF